MSKNKVGIEWNKFFEIQLVFFVIPTILFYLIAQVVPSFLHYMYYFIITLFSVQAMLSFTYSTSGLLHKLANCKDVCPNTDPPRTTFIVSAYLPNEIDVVEETLLNILKKVERPKDGIEVILAYNTPRMEPVEKMLNELAIEYPELILANAHGSRSKSENLNYSLQIASGEIIALLDADHIVNGDCLKRAYKWLATGYDAVQGRCKIRNGRDSVVSGIVEIEFEGIYGIAHYAKSLLFDAALFGGSNGYWKSSVIKELGFNTDVLTEDIETTLRATLKGYKIVHDRDIVSMELAPTYVGALWHQRKRWAQGWYQCSVKYQVPILKSKVLNFRKKFSWTTLLLWRVFYDTMTHFLFPTVLAFWLYNNRVDFPVNYYISFSIGAVLLSGPYETFAAYLNSSKPRASVLQFVAYACVTFPYTLLKNTIQVVAIRDELLGEKKWMITKR